jgi:hypothetical protein
VQTREWILTAAVIIVPLIIAVVVTLWSLDQVRYRPKKWQPPSSRGDAGKASRGATNTAEGES